MGGRKLYDRVPEHEHSVSHRQNYLQWCTTERRLAVSSGVDMQLEKELLSEVQKWREILKRIIDVVLFMRKTGLAFRGSSQRIGSINNGNFLGIIELLSRYDPVLQEHIKKVTESQTSGHCLSAHYLSSDSQNEFIASCAYLVHTTVIKEQQQPKYFSIIVDATPDSSHMEQRTNLLYSGTLCRVFGLQQKEWS